MKYIKRNIVTLILVLITLASCNQQGDKGIAVQKQDTTQHPAIQPGGNSIYQLPGNWTNQDKKLITLNDLKGKVEVMAMMFTNCKFACPRITGDIKAIEEQIPVGKRNRVGFVLVSFDSERDTPKQLKSFYDKMGLDEHWILLHGNEQQVRELSVLLNVSFKKGPDGIYAHSNIITVLDTAGNIRFQQEGLGVDPKETLSTINQLINSF